MYCRNDTRTVSSVLCTEEYYTYMSLLSLFGRVHHGRVHYIPLVNCVMIPYNRTKLSQVTLICEASEQP